MKEKVSQLAAVFSDFFMAACCLGSLIFIPLGLTGFAGALSFYSLKYRLLCTIVNIIHSSCLLLLHGLREKWPKIRTERFTDKSSLVIVKRNMRMEKLINHFAVRPGCIFLRCMMKPLIVHINF